MRFGGVRQQRNRQRLLRTEDYGRLQRSVRLHPRRLRGNGYLRVRVRSDVPEQRMLHAPNSSTGVWVQYLRSGLGRLWWHAELWELFNRLVHQQRYG